MKLADVLDIIDPAAAWHWISCVTFPPDGIPICPTCGATIVGHRALMSYDLLERTYCKACKSNSPARAFIPVLRGTEWQPDEYVKCLLLHLVGQHPAYIGSLLGKSAGCVRNMIERFTLLDVITTTGDRLLVDRDKKGAPRGGGAGNGIQTMEVTV